MINLYYDKIVEGIPAPNGAAEIALTDDARRVPYVKNHTPQTAVAIMNTFYFIVKSQKVVVKIYTEKQKAKNLFYPIELNDSLYNWDRDLTGLISNRPKKMIQKDHMKLLIVAPKLTGRYYHIERLKQRLDELVDYGIPKSNIIVLLGEINGVYNSLLDYDTYNLDYQQIYSQTLLKCRWGLSDLSWIFGNDTRANTLGKNEIEKEYTTVDNWNPAKVFKVITSKQDHDITLLLELIYRKLLDKGIFNFDPSDYAIKTANNNLIDPRKSSIEKQRKHGILKNIFDYKQTTNETVDSLFKIICDESYLNINTPYKAELSTLSPGHNIYKSIAQARPFTVIGNVDTMSYLNSQRYFSCNELLDQRYDKSMSVTKRVALMCNNIDRILGMEEAQLQKIIEDSKPFLKKNQERFFEKSMQSTLLELFVDMRYE